jgi:hypothetical protein
MKLLVVFTILIFSTSCIYLMCNNLKFDSTKWKNGNARDRGRMVYDLQEGKILIGKTNAEVKDLLGGSDYKNIVEGFTKGDVYDIETGILTEDYFTVHYDLENGKVTSTDVGD